MAFNFAHLLSAACGGAPRRLGRLRRPWARCARLFWGGYQHRKNAREGTHSVLVASRRCFTCQRRLALFADLLCRRHVPFAGAAER